MPSTPLPALFCALQGEPAPPPPDVPQKTCALVVGHQPSKPGAVNEARGLTEFAYNDALAKEIKAKVKKAHVEIVHRDNVSNGLSRLPAIRRSGRRTKCTGQSVHTGW